MEKTREKLWVRDLCVLGAFALLQDRQRPPGFRPLRGRGAGPGRRSGPGPAMSGGISLRAGGENCIKGKRTVYTGDNQSRIGGHYDENQG